MREVKGKVPPLESQGNRLVHETGDTGGSAHAGL
jgi:hypothetical protein